MRKFNVTVNGVSYEVEVEEMGEGVSAPVVSAPVVEKKAEVKKPVAVGNGTKLVAPMPGMVVNFKVAEGTTVKKGQPVVVLEAMKMENDITANADGVIKFVATKGSNVDTGDVLAVIA